MITLRRYDQFRGIEVLGTVWRLRKDTRELICTVSTHPLGHELRAASGDVFARSSVIKVKGEVFAVAEEWRTEAIEKGWKETL